MPIKRQFPRLDFEPMAPTRDALHAYARVLGDRLKAYRPRRKHWWHASLRPSLRGLTSGVVHAEIDFEMALDLRGNALSVQTSDGAQMAVGLDGQSAGELAGAIDVFLAENGVDTTIVGAQATASGDRFVGYSASHADSVGQVLAEVNAAMARFRSVIKRETSPIQLWPHHFDLSMLWLPGTKIEGQDPDDEESSDKQMNFGFAFGDAATAEPYFYVTAYPLPDAFPGLELPAGTRWQTDGFTGAVLPYSELIKCSDPHGYLQDLWAKLLSAGRDHMCMSDHAS